MNRLAEFVLGDGMLCACPFNEQTAPVFGTCCVVTIDGVSEFGRWIRVGDPLLDVRERLAGVFDRVADETDRVKRAGNEEAASRARAVLTKGAADANRSLHAVRLRFTVRRERLYLTLETAESLGLKAVFDTLEKRFQTEVHARFLTARDLSGRIGGVGVCGCVLCCSTGVCKRLGVELRLAKQQAIPLHDAVAAGHCGRLKCCIAYELDDSGAGAAPAHGGERN